MHARMRPRPSGLLGVAIWGGGAVALAAHLVVRSELLTPGLHVFSTDGWPPLAAFETVWTAGAGALVVAFAASVAWLSVPGGTEARRLIAFAALLGGAMLGAVMLRGAPPVTVAVGSSPLTTPATLLIAPGLFVVAALVHRGSGTPGGAAALGVTCLGIAALLAAHLLTLAWAGAAEPSLTGTYAPLVARAAPLSLAVSGTLLAVTASEPWGAAGLALANVLLVAAIAVPLWLAGVKGMPILYADYPASFAPLHRIASLAAFAWAAFLAVALLILPKRRAGRASPEIGVFD